MLAAIAATSKLHGIIANECIYLLTLLEAHEMYVVPVQRRFFSFDNFRRSLTLLLLALMIFIVLHELRDSGTWTRIAYC